MSRPSVPNSIHHIKLPATDISKTRDFYVHIVGLEYIPKYDHRTKDGHLFAFLLRLPGDSVSNTMIEIRYNPAPAEAQKGWDPITYGVRTKNDVDEWKMFLDSKDVTCSRVFTALQAWVLCALDTDGKIVRLYTEETHEWNTDFDHDSFWLGN